MSASMGTMPSLDDYGVVSQLASASYAAEQHAYMPGSVLAKDTQLQNLASKVFEELESSGTKYSDVAQKLHSLIDWMAVKGGRPPKNFKQKCLQFQKELALVPIEISTRVSIMQLIDKASRKRMRLSAGAKWGIGLGSAAVFMALAAVAVHVRGKRFMEPPAPLVVPVPHSYPRLNQPIGPVLDDIKKGSLSGVDLCTSGGSVSGFQYSSTVSSVSHTKVKSLEFSAIIDILKEYIVSGNQQVLQENWAEIMPYLTEQMHFPGVGVSYPLMTAIEHKQYDLVEFISKQHANPTSRFTINKVTGLADRLDPLWVASQLGDVRLMNILISSGARFSSDTMLLEFQKNFNSGDLASLRQLYLKQHGVAFV